jgi:undecaprenyl-diphosphatase
MPFLKMCLGESQIQKERLNKMKKGSQKNFCIATGMLIAFLLWTAAIQFVDMQTIGPQESSVGFATINRFVHNLTGVHMSLYTATDWLGLVPLGFVMGFALLGVIQWIQRKQLLKVDYNILVLGGFYIIVMTAYVFFEMVVVNYRPVLIDGVLEASYPSSTTMLVMCVMPTAVMQLNARLKKLVLKRFITSAITVFVVFMVIGRFVSGVHWFTDIIGGALLSTGLVLMYRAVVSLEVG